MSRSQSIVLVFGSSFDSGQLSAVAGEASILEEILSRPGAQAEVHVLSRVLERKIDGISSHVDLTSQPISHVDRLLRAAGAVKLRNLLATLSVGRLLNNLGPLDPGRVFWRAVRKSPEARALLKNADVVIAADMPAVKTAWIAQRRYGVAEAHYDHRAASVGISFQLPSTASTD